MFTQASINNSMFSSIINNQNLTIIIFTPLKTKETRFLMSEFVIIIFHIKKEKFIQLTHGH